MANEEVMALRGKQVTLFASTFQFPDDVPETDERIVEFEEMVVAIERATDGPREIVSLGRKMIGDLRDRIGQGIREREAAKQAEVWQSKLPMGDEAAPPKKVSSAPEGASLKVTTDGGASVTFDGKNQQEVVTKFERAARRGKGKMTRLGGRKS